MYFAARQALQAFEKMESMKSNTSEAFYTIYAEGQQSEQFADLVYETSQQSSFNIRCIVPEVREPESLFKAQDKHKDLISRAKDMFRNKKDRSADQEYSRDRGRTI